VKKLIAISLFWLAACTASAQTPVKQSGTVTPGHVPMWTTNGVIQDGGTAAQGFPTSFGVTASGPGICQNSGPITAAYNQICLDSTSTGMSIDINNQNGATGGLTIKQNGSAIGFPTVYLPVTANDVACFFDSSGTIKDCNGVLPSAYTYPSPILTGTVSGPQGTWEANGLNSVAIGATTPSTGNFTSGGFTGNASVGGNLSITGTTTTNIMGSTQCVEANSAGVLIGVGFNCQNSASNVPFFQDFVASNGDFTPGSTTSLTLTNTPANAAAVAVAFDGVVQSHNTWSLSTATITFNAAIPSDTQVVDVEYSVPTSITGVTSVNGASGAVTTAAGNGLTQSVVGAQTTFGPFGQIAGGRLTLVSGQAVQTSDVTAATAIYYAPQHGKWPYDLLYNGTQFVPVQFTASATDTTGLSLILDTNAASGSIYDVFEGLDGAIDLIGYGPAWASSTGSLTGACGAGSARGSGAGTTQLAMLDNICVNANTITLRYNNGVISGTFSCAQYKCAYKGSFAVPAATTTLSAAITSTSQTTISPTDSCGTGTFCFPYSSSSVPLSFYIQIDSEIMLVSGGNSCTLGGGSANTCQSTYSGTWTVMRAQMGTSAATHLNGATISMAPGQTQCVLHPSFPAGGGNNSGCWIYNAENKEPMMFYSRDASNVWSWTLDGAWRETNNQSAERITWLDGLGDTNVQAFHDELLGGCGDIGVSFDWTSGDGATGLISLNGFQAKTVDSQTGVLIGDGFNVGAASGNQSVQSTAAKDTMTGLGLHYVQAIEYEDASVCGSHTNRGLGAGNQMLYVQTQF
jgi:hypothetical protein